MKLGVIAALQTEIKPSILALAPSSRKIEHLRFHESPNLVFVAGGIGARLAAAAAMVMVQHFKPDALVSTGFCGALSDEFETADLLLGGTKKRPPDERLLELARAAAPQARTGVVRTVEKVVNKADEK